MIDHRDRNHGDREDTSPNFPTNCMKINPWYRITQLTCMSLWGVARGYFTYRKINKVFNHKFGKTFPPLTCKLHKNKSQRPSEAQAPERPARFLRSFPFQNRFHFSNLQEGGLGHCFPHSGDHLKIKQINYGLSDCKEPRPANMQQRLPFCTF